jgi:hypothetical protein
MNTITLVQEVFFDLCDFLDNENCNKKLTSFDEFKTIKEFLIEQKQKLAEIETQLTQGK